MKLSLGILKFLNAVSKNADAILGEFWPSSIETNMNFNVVIFLSIAVSGCKIFKYVH